MQVPPSITRRGPRLRTPLLMAAAGLAAMTVAASPAHSGAAGNPVKAQAFTACMRSHGVPDFPGVTLSDDGRVNLSLTPSGVNPISARYQAAAKECAPLLPGGSRLPARPRPPTPSPPAAPAPPTLPAELP